MFFGRERELAGLCNPAGGKRNALTTLVGPPGSGKSRLAQEMRTRLTAVGQHIQRIDVAGLKRLEDLVHAVDDLDAHPDDLGQALLHFGRSLSTCDALILDNAEHLRAPLNEHIQTLLSGLGSCPLIVTSRERLGCAQEHILELPFLPTEGLDAPARELFVHRARRLDPEFPRTPSEESAITELVHRLEGCPLAIELAACRAARMGAQVVAEQLRDFGLGVIPGSGGFRFASLVAAVEWSWERLDNEQQATLTAVSLLPGSWSVADASALLGLHDAQTLDQIESLRDASLVQIDPDERTRYRTYGIVREVVTERTPPGTRTRLFRALTDYVTQPPLGASLFYSPPAPTFGTGTLHFVADECVVRHEPERALQALLRLHSRYGQRGPHAPYAGLLERLSAQLESARARALCSLARAEVESWRGHFEAAAKHADASMAMLPPDSDPTLEALILATCARLAGAIYRPEDAMPLFEKAHAVLRGPGHELQRAWLDQQMGLFLIVHDPAEAEQRVERALLLARNVDQPKAIVQTLSLLASSHLARGMHAAAAQAVAECESLLSGIDDSRSKGIVSMLRALVEHESGNIVEALAHYESSLADHRESGSAWLIGFAEMGLAEALFDDGKWAESELAFTRALSTLRPLNEKMTTVWTLCGLGTLSARRGELVPASDYFRDAEERAERVPVPALREMVRMRRVELDFARLIASENSNEESPEWMAFEERIGELQSTSYFGLRFPLRRLLAHVEASRPVDTRHHLVVDAAGRWFSRAGVERVDLRTRTRLCRVLACLAKSKRGDWIELSALYEAGWPGERCLPGSDTNRVHVTLSRLRSLGLGDLIDSDEGRFRFDPEWTVTLKNEV